MSKTKVYAIVIILLLTMFILGVASVRNDSVTNDEAAHIPAGYSYLKTGDYRLNPEHPPLIKDLSAIPLLFMNIKAPFDHPSWQKVDQWEFGHQFLYKYGNNVDNIALASRIPIILLMVLLGFYIFKWTRELYGDKAGLFALFLYALAPNVLAHGRLVTTDLGISAMFVIALYYFWRFIKKPSWKLLVIAGITFGLAQLTKFNGLLIIPIMIIFTFVAFFIGEKEIKLSIPLKRLFKKRKLLQKAYVLFFALILIFIIGYGLVWLVYIVQTANMPVAVQHQIINNSLDNTMTKVIINRLADIPVVRAFDHYLLGISMAGSHTVGGHTIFFLGQIGNGWWYYFPVIFVLKTSILVLGLMLAGLIFACYKYISSWRDSGFVSSLEKYFTELMFFVSIFIFFAAGMKGKLDLGVRYLLPVYAFIFILLGGFYVVIMLKLKSLDTKTSRRGTYLGFFITGIIVVWYVISALYIYPSYLAYYNEAIGPANGYKYATDSNLDWGQDLKRLKIYIDDKNIPEINLIYFGHAEPGYYKINYHDYWSKDKNIKGYTAISATTLQTTRNKDNSFSFQWLRDKQPIDNIGYSIFIYYLK